jgi:hypothetical protein
MPDALPVLERQQAEVLRRMAGWGDLRRASMTTTSGQCGKPTGHCAKPGDPGHGPHHRLTRKVKGKTITETFVSPARVRQAEREAAEFHHFQQLCEEVVVVSRDAITVDSPPMPLWIARRRSGLPVCAAG